MKPFNLEKAKQGKPIQTRDGRKARFVAHVPEVVSVDRVIAVVEGIPYVVMSGEDGYLYPSFECSSDLFMAPTIITEKRWIVWRLTFDRKHYYVYGVYENEDEALKCAELYGSECQIREITETFEI